MFPCVPWLKTFLDSKHPGIRLDNLQETYPQRALSTTHLQLLFTAPLLQKGKRAISFVKDLWKKVLQNSGPPTFTPTLGKDESKRSMVI
jgi:hypothetical protein